MIFPTVFSPPVSLSPPFPVSPCFLFSLQLHRHGGEPFWSTLFPLLWWSLVQFPGIWCGAVCLTRLLWAGVAAADGDEVTHPANVCERAGAACVSCLPFRHSSSSVLLWSPRIMLALKTNKQKNWKCSLAWAAVEAAGGSTASQVRERHRRSEPGRCCVPTSVLCRGSFSSWACHMTKACLRSLPEPADAFQSPGQGGFCVFPG